MSMLWGPLFWSPQSCQTPHLERALGIWTPQILKTRLQTHTHTHNFLLTLVWCIIQLSRVSFFFFVFAISLSVVPSIYRFANLYLEMCPPYINCNFLSVRLMFEEVRKCLWLHVPGCSCCRCALVPVQWQTVVKYVHNNVSQAPVTSWNCFFCPKTQGCSVKRERIT